MKHQRPFQLLSEATPLLSQLPQSPRLRRVSLAAASLMGIGIIAFTLNVYSIEGGSLLNAYVVLGAIQIVATVATLVYAARGKLVVGLRLFVIVVFATAMIEPYLVSDEGKYFALILLPPILLGLLVTGGLVWSLKFVLLISFLAAVNTTVAYGIYLPVVSTLPFPPYRRLLPLAGIVVLMGGAIVYAWSYVTGSLLEQANHLIKEREILIRETNHRVKNSLQLITSILDMQSRESDEPVVHKALTEARNRINAIAAVHRSLHESGETADVEAGLLLEKVVEAFRETLGMDVPAKLELDREEAGVKVSAKALSPLGLSMNELTTNAVQHGLRGVSAPSLTVAFARRGRGREFVIRDNGVGLPAGFDPRNQESLGLTLVYALIEEQLEGTVSFEPADPGTVVRLWVPERHFSSPAG